MGWRSLLVTQPARLSMDNAQLLIEQNRRPPVRLPLEDISVLVLETSQILVSGAVLSQLSEHGIACITCNRGHLPNGLLLPYLPHSRSLQVMQKQLAMTKAQKKRAWQSIVQQKLINQGHCLQKATTKSETFLLELAKRVGSGDPENCEAIGAQYYFTALFGQDFNRDQASWRNAALNYGYTIVRSAVARALVCYGFLPPFGLHHHSQLNAFNLADDLMEPLRPMVDIYVYQQGASIETALSVGTKAELVQLLHADIGMPRGRLTMLAAINQMCEALGRYLKSADPNDLEWPVLVESGRE